MGKRVIAAVSGGPDSVFLVEKRHGARGSCILAHVNHAVRGGDSEADQELVEQIGRELGITVELARVDVGIPAGFEEKARKARYDFFRELKKKYGAGKILLAHTADDQVETILMRILEGAGISGLKGIPRKTKDGIERPLLDTWKEDIQRYLRKHRISSRVDKSNFDIRFERNWIRHVLIPLLEKRYGKSVKKRIFALGERFREIDEYLEDAARKWMKRNVRTRDGEAVISIPRKKYAGLPAAARKKILQLTCFERVGISPNERLLESMDRLIVDGKASGQLNIGKKHLLRRRYDQAILEIEKTGESKTAKKGVVPDTRIGTSTGMGRRAVRRMNGPGRYEIFDGKGRETPLGVSPGGIVWEEKGRVSAGGLRRLAREERAAAFDGGEIRLPLFIRRLRAGDRIRPFGLSAEKKVKEILIDRKIPRDERWGRPVVCDAEGRILWIPEVVRAAHAPVTGRTRRTIVLRSGFSPAPRP